MTPAKGSGDLRSFSTPPPPSESPNAIRRARMLQAARERRKPTDWQIHATEAGRKGKDAGRLNIGGLSHR